MKKFLILILIISSFAFAKERRSYTYAYVNHSEPIYQYKYDRVYEECEEDYYHNTDYVEESNNFNGIGLDTIVGATIGVAIGNQIGRGNGRDVARVAGGLLGATIANNTRHERYGTSQRHYRKQHNQCENNYTQRKRKVLTGYKNYFTYDNREYFKITKRPRNKIRITKTISF